MKRGFLALLLLFSVLTLRGEDVRFESGRIHH